MASTAPCSELFKGRCGGKVAVAPWSAEGSGGHVWQQQQGGN